MNATTYVAKNEIGSILARYSREMKKGMRDTVRIAARGVMRFVIDNTPPNSAAGRGRDGMNAGRIKIARQMSSVLVPVKLKGRRRIPVVFGHRLKRPITVPTREMWPDVAGVYRANSGPRAGGIGMVTKPGRRFYVDVRKFQAVLKAKQARVGALAAGWVSGANALDVPVQSWISRHGSGGGRSQVTMTDDTMAVVVENFGNGVPANLRYELARRVDAAVGYQRDTMLRGIAGYHNRLRRELGINGRDR